MRGDVTPQAFQSVAKCRQQSIRRRVVLFSLIKHLPGSSGWIDFPRRIAEPLLIQVEVLLTDFEELVERDIDHLVIEELLTAGARQQIALEPCQIRLQILNDASVALLKLTSKPWMSRVFERQRNIIFEKRDDARPLLDRHFGIDARRIFRLARAVLE